MIGKLSKKVVKEASESWWDFNTDERQKINTIIIVRYAFYF